MQLFGATALAVSAAILSGCGKSSGTLGSLPRGITSDTLNLVVVTLDTTRADRIGCYGDADAETPNLDALARRGVRFQNAVSAMPLTLPAHSSLFTARLPGGHGVRDNGGFTLAPDQETLAEALHGRGFATGGFVSAYVLDRKWGISQGFDRYFDDFDLSQFEAESMGNIQRRGDATLDQSLAWIRDNAQKRFFAWIHFYDPHAPYDPPEPYATRFSGHPYDGEIAWTDSLVGRLLQELQRLGLTDRTVVAVIGDHGESLGEHGENGHGFFIYTQTTHVPFLLAAPYSGLSGQTVPGVVHQIDVAPTLVELLGLPPLARAQGRSLVPVILGRGGTPASGGWSESFYPRFHYGWSELRSVRSGPWHFIEAPRAELYDLTRDPQETTNTAEQRPEVVAEMRGLLERVESSAGEAPEAPAPVEEDEETLRKLAALGYVGSLSAATARPGVSWRDLPDPKDRVAIYNLINRAKEESLHGDPDRALEMLDSVLAQDPEVIDACFMIGNVWFKRGDWERAAEWFSRTLEKRPDHDFAMIGLADTLVARGRIDDALVGYRRYLETDPRNAQISYRMAEVLLDAGRNAEAGDAFRLTLSISPGAARAEVGRGVVAFRAKDFAGARVAIGRALAIDPKARNARFNLGLLDEAEGHARQAAEEYRAEIANDSRAYRALFNLGRLLAREGDRAGAVAALHACARVRPEFAVGRFFLAQALLDSGDLAGAISEAQAGLDQDPASEYAPLGQYVLADAYARQGRAAESREAARRGRELESRQRHAAVHKEDS